jgi:hypothetical protein
MEYSQSFKKWFELKTRLGKNCTIDKFSSEGRPNICGRQTATEPELALLLLLKYHGYSPFRRNEMLLPYR